MSATTLAETFTTAVASATSTLAAFTPIPTTNAAIEQPPIPGGLGNAADEASKALLCDWIRSASDCRDAGFIRSLLIASSVMHGLVFLFGFWLLTYRNRGLNSRIVTELFVKVGTGVRPKPMDCIVFFTAIASLIKVGVNIPLILDVLKDMLWVRIAIEQTYWIFVAVGFSSYFVGLLYAMPVTTREGIFAVYQPETAFEARPLPPIHVLTPTTGQKNFVLLMGAIYPAIFGAGAGVASAVFAQKPGYERISKILLKVQYSNWVLILWSMAIMFFYYGLKYTFILRANIIIAEAALKAPKAAFGISNLRSASPARFLFIQLQITGFGGAAVTLLAGSLCMIWVLCREQILVMPNDQLPHTMAFFWTCAIAVAFFVIMALIAVQSVRNRRRGLHEPSTSLTNSFVPHSGQKSSGQGSSSAGASKSPFSSQNHHQKASSARSESEARLAQRSSGELSTLHSLNSVERPEHFRSSSFECAGGELYEDPTATVAAMFEASRRMDNDAFSVSHQANRSEQERSRKTLSGSPASPASPAKAFTITAHGDSERRGSEASSISSAKAPVDLRYSVYGGARSMRPNSPPPSSSSPNAYSFPLTALRSSPKSNKSEGSSKSKSSRQPGPTTSQISNNSSSHTTSSSSHTLSAGSSREIRYPTIYESRGDTSQAHGGPYAMQAESQEYGSGLQYHGSIKGLSPPPRSQRLPNSAQRQFPASPATEAATVLPIPPTMSPPSGPMRNTFMNSAPGSGGYAGGMQYSDTPRVGGGVRRKSLKGVDDAATPDPEWPLPPTIAQ
ncbi:hypothetical protein BGZ67_003862 [Mortierella alpina]|nr:hypothetical protein BGZ67_003862 [Mortierella alpina]